MSGSIANFTFGIEMLMQQNGNLKCAAHWINAGVPDEMIVMQLRALIRQLEDKYFDAFDRDAPGARPK